MQGRRSSSLFSLCQYLLIVCYLITKLYIDFNIVCLLSIFSFCEGGLGEAVAGVLSGHTGIAIRRLAVQRVPQSGPSKLLLEEFGISANCIVKAAKEMLN